MTQSQSNDQEFKAMQSIYELLEPLNHDARQRIIGYIISRLEISGVTISSLKTGLSDLEEIAADETHSQDVSSFTTFAELFEAVDPNTNADKALVAGYWLQICQGAENFDGQSANKELRNLGHVLSNITHSIDILKKAKPALALQLRKSGKSQQSRKTYKITIAGEKKISEMISAE